ncbi:hypothetical protein [Bdellovibrio bacteriovorus]|uniref:RxLR effector protein n=1 Tax=Bdellovibrio bacteriovorus TaxID=959 RepID=A0A150WIF4_BDEBC|nr:hypothetical protein [Bdellovibrio bacteriovorus]KYG61349.1 hypothetical protein AZI87_17680 [Bdellovibrio bacteriovorus]KYG63481.1 hypothetical protein AZI85_05505 [Bdellovibrio bacteriovorus]KYG67560.1 hypothetical protein AZI87_17945 [Bdellovibrio bacteriovorus]
MLRLVKQLTVMVAMILAFDVSFAQSTSRSSTTTTTTTTVKKERKATLNFEDELIEGSTQKPDLFYLFQKKNFNYKRLIKLRENFLPEMRRTTEDIQRVRGGN